MSMFTVYSASVTNTFSTVNSDASVINVSTEAPPPPLRDMVRAARDRAGLTQTELGERVGMSQRWVSDVERGETEVPRAGAMRALARELGLDLGQLYVACEIAQTRTEGLRVAKQLEGVNELSDAHATLHQVLPQLTPEQAAALVKFASYVLDRPIRATGLTAKRLPRKRRVA